MLIDFLLYWSRFRRLCMWLLSMGKKISWGSWWGDLSNTSVQVPNSFWILDEVCYNFGKNIIYIFIPIRHVPPSVKSEMPSVAAVSLVRDFFKIINTPIDFFLWCLLILEYWIKIKIPTFNVNINIRINTKPLIYSIFLSKGSGTSCWSRPYPSSPSRLLRFDKNT